jgi:error-prone DNA polymerase
VAGVVLVRQRPGSASGVVFVTIEDETGIANLVVWPSLTERDRQALIGSTLLLVAGRIQHSPEGVVHVVADHLTDRSAWLHALKDDIAAPPPSALVHADDLFVPRAGSQAGHSNQSAAHLCVRHTVPRSRNFR